MNESTAEKKEAYMWKHAESLMMYKEILQEADFSEIEIAHILQEHQAHLYRQQAMSGIGDMQKMVTYAIKEADKKYASRKTHNMMNGR